MVSRLVAGVREGWILGPLLFIFALSCFFPFALIDFDPHHDGLMAAQAVALYEGNFIHREIFAQYGPVTPWSQVLFLGLPVSPGLALKLWAAFYIALTAGILADFWRVLPSSLRIGPQASAVGSALWILSSDIWSQSYMLPWSSVLSSFLVVLAVYLFFAGKKVFGVRPLCSGWLLFASGTVFGLIPFARINVGLLALSAASLILLIQAKTEIFLPRKGLRVFFLGAVFAAAGVLAFLGSGGALSGYFDQALVGPLLWASQAAGPGQWDTIPALLGIMWSLLPALIAFVGLIALGFVSERFASQHGTNRLWLGSYLFASLFLVGTVLVEVTQSRDLLYQLLTQRTLQSVRALGEGFLLGNNLILFFGAIVSFIAVAIALLLAPKQDSGCKQVGMIERQYTLLFLSGASLALMAQIVPTYDSRHVWWGSALVALVGIASFRIWAPIGERGIQTRLTRLASVGVVGLLALMASVGAFSQFSKPRFIAPEGTIAEGIWVQEGVLSYLVDAEAIGRRIPIDATAGMLVHDGALAVITARYLAPDESFVWWAAPDRNLARYLAGIDLVWIDSPTAASLGYGNPRELATGLGLRIIACEGGNCLAATSSLPVP